MYARVSELKNLTISALDGDIGRCRDLLFDDVHWTVRYLEVNTSRWLLGRRVLISPAVVGIPDIENKRLPVEVEKTAIESAPGLDKDQPVSRQYEAAYAQHYGQLYYWWGGGIWGTGPYPGDILSSRAAIPPTPGPELDDEDNHLRSADEVIGYKTHAADGDIGEVRDFILDTRTWTIGFVALDTRRWLPGRKILMPVSWVSGISWSTREFHVDVTREAIRTAPEIEEPLSIEAIKAYYAHFGKAA
ncbi:MAG: PRC-barrel domain-containing protein [Halieaceae bacterium]|jgi:hypothetical protein|nr:PRC-barrel domain-containing protein [Halieaceae bacterium]